MRRQRMSVFEYHTHHHGIRVKGQEKTENEREKRKGVREERETGKRSEIYPFP